ncbi:class I SAM-dependent methyltransferase [Hoeflea sp. YIM 152468]|uniref:class I SAM-dependent DNA methyltransferase n=1 Tax=Hoeflea sp. YIM 152468 TaxID=3031759 RepID=UPI0023DC5763|nr:class I SAM-dependent methyltransferase [Hoeflea sp. YIM 152468]MDF1609252.1 class I SAM-dependent methyltransferase [Hoeflea sp. YIM 152468]
MTSEDKTARLGAVYQAESVDDVARVYDLWAEQYDGDMSLAGYRHPAISLAMLARHVPKGAGPLLDAGAGTGLIGEWLAITGYCDVDALDVSTGMLAVAERKGVYKRLHKAALGSTLPFSDHHFAAIISAGVFTSGHVGIEGLDDLLRICASGGILVLTVKDKLWQTSFSQRISDLQAADICSLVDDTGPYVSMPGEKGTTPSRCIALKLS